MSTPRVAAASVPTLEAGLLELNLSLPARAVTQLNTLLDELEKWNFAYNLTAVRARSEMVTRHVLDSLAILPLVHGRILDVGAGAGLPCLPLAIANPDLQVVGLDSNGKKTRFMRHIQRTLGLTNFSVVEGRIEALPRDLVFDVVTSRAFASLHDFFTHTHGLLAENGQWLAMKGHVSAEEIADVPDFVQVEKVHPLQVPGLAEARHAVIAVVKS